MDYKRCRILCFGNELHGDDGYGIYVFQQLLTMSWPENVEIIEVGITGLNAMSYFENCSEVMIVDALTNQGKPGKIHWLDDNDILFSKIPLAPFEKKGEFQEKTFLEHHSHGMDVYFLIAAVKATVTPLPTITIVGAEITKIQMFVQKLSVPVMSAVAETSAKIHEYVTNCYE